jgi:putative hemolysin
MFNEILITFALMLLNGVFAMSEISIVSSRRVRLQKMAEKGSKGAVVALELSNEPNRFLSTVQFGITLIGIVQGVFGGNSLSAKLTPMLMEFESIKPYAETVSFSIVIIAITFFSLIIGELVPKRIGMSNPESIAVVLAPIMKFVAKIGSPFVWLLSKSTDLLLRILGLNKVKEQSVTEEEIKALIEEGTQGGHFEKTEQKMVEQVFRMADKRTDMLMTPRLDIEWLDNNSPFSENIDTIYTNTHTYFPVCEDSLDTIHGILHLKDLINFQLKNPNVQPNFKELCKTPLFVPENMRAFKLLEMMREEKEDFALVIDEFGTVQGCVTMNDVLQEIANIHPDDENASEEEKIIKREDGTFIVDGMLPKDYFKDYFRIKMLPDEDEYNTVAGLVINGLKYIPEVGETYTFENYCIEIIDMDGNRIDKVIVKVL